MNDYITLKDGQKVRVEANWNAYAAFLKATQKDSMQALASLAELRPSEVAEYIAACVNEGERLDGRTANFTGLEMGERIDINVIGEFFKIYSAQSAPGIKEDNKKKDRKANR